MTESDLTVPQRNFLRLHVKRVVYMWQWHLGETQLRAHAGTFRATIWRDELNDLIARGLMYRGTGNIIGTTTAGRELVR